MIWLFVFAIGFVAGLRSFTAPAAVAWAARLGWLSLAGTPLAFLRATATVAIFTLFALAEYVTDQLPRTPARTTPGPLAARAVTGGLSGAALALAAGQSIVAGVVLGAIAGVAGAFAGYQVRTRTVRALQVPDFVVAVAEDLVAIGVALLIVSRV
jgi:uncharacterized membrane protein